MSFDAGARGLGEASWLRIVGFVLGLVALQIAGVYLGAGALAALGVDVSKGSGFLLATLGMPTAFGLAWTWLFAAAGGRSWRDFGFRPLPAQALQIALLAAPVCFVVGALVASALEPLLGQPSLPGPIAPRQGHTDLAFVASFVLCGVILAPLLEEAVFRGVLYASLRRRLGVAASAAIAAIAHAAVHFDLAALAPLAVIFFLFGLLYERAGSLWAPTIAHGGHNLISMGLAYMAALRPM